MRAWCGWAMVGTCLAAAVILQPLGVLSHLLLQPPRHVTRHGLLELCTDARQCHNIT